MKEEKVESEEVEESKQDDPKEESKQDDSKGSGEDFEKSGKPISPNRYNQVLRKLREAELEKRELEKKLESPPAKEAEEENEEEPEVKKDVSALVEEKIKPVLDSMKKREEDDKRKDRVAFFEAHPEYRESGEKWSGLLETMDEFVNPSSGKSYYEQLNAAHVLFVGQDHGESETAQKKREMAGDAASSGAGAQKADIKEEFTSEDRKTMKQFNISEEGMKAYKKKIASGSMAILR